MSASDARCVCGLAAYHAALHRPPDMPESSHAALLAEAEATARLVGYFRDGRPRAATDMILRLAAALRHANARVEADHAALRAEDYHAQQDGEWVEPTEDYRMACCDCGLVHRMEFRADDEGTVQFRAWRDEDATAARRGATEGGDRGE